MNIPHEGVPTDTAAGLSTCPSFGTNSNDANTCVGSGQQAAGTAPSPMTTKQCATAAIRRTREL